MTVPWCGILPFAVLLAAIATSPLMPRTRHLWERRSFQLLLSLSLGLPMAAWCWSLGGRPAVIHAVVEYLSFITLLFALFVVSGGVIFIGTGQAVVELALSIASFTYGGFLGLFLLAVRGKSSPRAATIGFVAGVSVMVWVVLGTKLAWPFYTLAGSLVTLAVATVTSAFEGRTAAPRG